MSEKQSVATAIPVSVPIGGPPPTPMHLQEKQGAKCCGCCCDYRRAVTVVSMIYVVLNLLFLAGSLGAFAIPGSELGIDDDEVLAYWDDTLKDAAIMSGIGLLFSIFALIGAAKFNKYLVGANIVWIIAAYITGVVLSVNNIEEANVIFADHDDYIPQSPTLLAYVVEGLVAMLLIYPHAGFIHEVQTGIMSEETYPREMFSCCCTPSRM